MPCSFFKGCYKRNNDYNIHAFSGTSRLSFKIRLKFKNILKLICKVMLMQDQPDCNFFFYFKTWKDPRLAWNTSHYGGVKSIRLKESSIWRPDIEVANQ